jgi:hypothetical protein
MIRLVEQRDAHAFDITQPSFKQRDFRAHPLFWAQADIVFDGSILIIK